VSVTGSRFDMTESLAQAALSCAMISDHFTIFPNGLP
jgi:hypothetical protein